MEYKAIARRFRPTRFSEVTGQDPVVVTLRNAALQKKASHAYLFTGIRGTGKTTLARIFAKALNCEALTSEGEPCNACASCLEIIQGKSLDFIEIDGASNRGIDDIRNLNETLGYRAIKGRYKIYLIDEVHMLTKEAFNALLKSLEEPPANVKFFFATTEVNKVLPTIISRCQRFDLTRISNHEIIKKLRQISKEIQVDIEDEALALISKLSEGSLRDAESLFDQISCSTTTLITSDFILETLGFVSKKDFFLLDQAFKQQDLTFAFKFASKLFSTGRDITYFLENLLEHFRNLMLIHLKHLQIEDAFLSEEEKTGYQASSLIYEQNQLIHILDYLSDLIHQSTRPTYKRIHLEMILLHILQSRNRVSLDSILQKLSNMEGANIEIGEEVTSNRMVSAAPIKEEVKVIFEKVEENLETKDLHKEFPKEEEVKVLDVKKILPNHRYDTVLRFAQVEFGATLKKN
jgi:DNA polymerase-3 subunit gamma/tau